MESQIRGGLYWPSGYEEPLAYSFSYENLEAIIAGLAPGPEDRILAVGSSGDQAFALLEYAGGVDVVDNNPVQLEYIKERVGSLMNGDYDEFLPPPCGFVDESTSATDSSTQREKLRRRNHYFREQNRLEKIRAKLSKLKIREPADILIVARDEAGFTKLYLSNVFMFDDPWPHNSSPVEMLRRIAQNLPVGGLIYVSNHTIFPQSEQRGDLSLHGADYIFSEYSDYFLPSELVLDKELTRKALGLDFYHWRAAVYRRV